MMFSHQLVMRGDVSVIYCSGRIVAEETAELRSTVLGAIEDTGRVVLHLASVSYVDSTGLGLLAFFCSSARKRSGDVKLVAPSAQVAEVLELTMLGRLFRVYASEDDAVAAFAAGARVASNNVVD
ncbi:MAG TPA: STAS domain-containing protein [Terriglobales bacterium]